MLRLIDFHASKSWKVILVLFSHASSRFHWVFRSKLSPFGMWRHSDVIQHSAPELLRDWMSPISINDSVLIDCAVKPRGQGETFSGSRDCEMPTVLVSKAPNCWYKASKKLWWKVALIKADQPSQLNQRIKMNSIYVYLYVCVLVLLVSLTLRHCNYLRFWSNDST